MSDTTRGERFVEIDFYERDLDGARFVDCRFTAFDSRDLVLLARADAGGAGDTAPTPGGDGC